jgi:GT2 family glycosyltransferase
LTVSEALTVAIANYNGRDLMATVLLSLERQTLRSFHTVVVDDASTDDSVDWLRANWPDVEIIAAATNRGVSATLNACLRAGNGDFVALLNNDVELHPRFLEELVAALNEHPDAGVAAAKLIDFYDRDVIDGAGDVYGWAGEADRRGHGQRDVGQYQEPRPVFGACAGAALYRRTAFEQVGPFDERFFAFYEDVDWSFRAQLLGLSCRYVPSAIAYHIGSATLGTRPNDFSLYQNWRNAIWVVAKNYPRAALVRHGYEFLRGQQRRLGWAVSTGHAGLFARAWRDAMRGMPAILGERRNVQRTRSVGLRELERVIGVAG